MNTTAIEARDRIAEEVQMLETLIADLRMQASRARGRDLPSMGWEFAKMGDIVAARRLDAEANMYAAVLVEHLDALREADAAVIAELPAVEPDAGFGFAHDGRCRVIERTGQPVRTVAQAFASARRLGWN